MDEDKRLPFQDVPELNQEQDDAQGEQFWAHIAELLEQIEANTRGGAGRGLSAAAVATPARPKEEAKEGKKHAGGPGAAHSNAAIRTTARTAPAERRPSRSIIPSPPAHQEKAASSSPLGGRSATKAPHPAGKGKNQDDGLGGGTRPHAPRKQKEPGAPLPLPTKSQEALAQKREEAIAQKQSKGILGALKQNLASWDGSVASSDKSDMQDAAGLAAGGPLWSALKELKEVIPENDKEDDSLAGVLKKTITQKTGVTAARERIDRAAETARAKVVTWAGGRIDAPKRGNRDKRGRFIKGAGKESRIAEKTLALASQEAREGKKRHDELVEAVKQGPKHGGGGLFGEDGLVDRMGRRRGARGAGTSKPGRMPGRRGKFGLLAGAGATLLGGASVFNGDPVSSAIDIGSAALSAPGAGKAAGAAGKALGLGAKGALGAAKAIPIAGQVLAAGMALYDGVSGWNNADMHREAFGLEDGQEASTGQKASAAAANILDMGGLLTGAAGLFGFEVSTSDIARGIFDFGDSIGSTLSDAWGGVTSLFSSDDEEGAQEGLFGKLTEAISDLTDTIDDDIREKEKPGIIASAGGFFSRFFGGDDSGSRGNGGDRSTRQDTGATRRAQAIMGKELGALSAQYESGAHGSDAIGYDRTGGTSYGKYQIASNTGTMDAFLRWAERNGGENGKEVAARMRSSGPLNTGSKSGAAVDTWRSLEREGKLGTLEHDFIKATHFDPAFAGIQSEELRKRVEGSKALQDVLWSTSVQHGAGGAAKLINRNFKQGMSDEEFINALYADRATQFGSSTVQVQKSARNRFADERQVALAMLQRERRGAAQMPQTAVEATSQALQLGTQEAIDRGVRYSFGSKNSGSGGIDCSGWVTENTRNMMEAVNAESGKPIYGKEAQAVLRKGANGGAAGLIQTVSEATGELLSNDALAPDRVREGMMIGMDTGDKGWDQGRFGGIDHIVQTYRDAETGRMMVSESSSRKGVTVTDYEEWYKKWNGHANLYGTDITKLADASQFQPSEGATVADVGQTGAEAREASSEKKEQTSVASASPATAAPQEVQTVAVQEVQPQASQRYPEPEPIRPEPFAAPQQIDFSQVIALLTQLVDVTRQNATGKERDTENASSPNIPMDYDDPFCLALAHDRA